jgi:hypothetical protein
VTSPGSTANWGAAVRAKARVASRTAGATHPATGEPAARLRVLYTDTDAGGVVYHGSYLRFFKAGRTEAMRSAGVPLARFAQHKFHLPLIEQTIRYRTPAFYDDILLVYVARASSVACKSRSSTRCGESRTTRWS